MPESTVVAIGTAITGNVDMAATTPARCAAPPAATITTFRPRETAVEAYSCVRAGDRCAEVTSISYGTPNFSSIFADSLITGKSVSEPMMIPTSGLPPCFDPSRVLTRDGSKQRSEEHTSELQSRQYLVCRLLLDKKK